MKKIKNYQIINYRLKSIIQKFDKSICKVIETLSIFQIMFFNHIYEKKILN